MKLTAITQQKRNLDNVNLFLDEEFWISLSKNQLLEFGLHKGSEITERLKKELEEASGLNRMYEKALNFLSYRPRSVSETRTRLMQKYDADEKSAESIIQQLQTQGLLDDEKFTRWYVENRVQSSKLHGEKKIQQELFKKGIEQKLAKKIVAELSIVNEELRINKLKEFVEKEKNKLEKKHDDEFKIRQKVIEKLLRKGFNYGEVKELVH